MTQSKHGGQRPGAGRKPKYGEPLVPRRIPSSGQDELDVELSKLQRELANARNSQRPSIRYATELPLFESHVPAGEPMSSVDDVEAYVDANDLVGVRDGANYFVKVSGESMIDAGILPGDILSVKHCSDAAHGDVVVAAVDNGLTVKRFHSTNGCRSLHSENSTAPNFSENVFSEGRILGIVYGLVRRF